MKLDHDLLWSYHEAQKRSDGIIGVDDLMKLTANTFEFFLSDWSGLN
jgi:hypothetical protein